VHAVVAALAPVALVDLLFDAARQLPRRCDIVSAGVDHDGVGVAVDNLWEEEGGGRRRRRESAVRRCMG
jgi:hypothetical protein